MASRGPSRSVFDQQNPFKMIQLVKQDSETDSLAMAAVIGYSAPTPKPIINLRTISQAVILIGPFDVGSPGVGRPSEAMEMATEPQRTISISYP